MVMRRQFSGFGLRAGSLVGALLSFVLLLYLLPEPTDSRSGDYLPSSRGRAITAKIIKSPKPLQGENSGVAGFDFAVVGQPQPITNLQASIVAELFFQLRHFGFLNNRLGRSPPVNS